MTSTGFTVQVGWATSWPTPESPAFGSPHTSQALLTLADLGDVTGAASSVERPSLSAEVPVVATDGLELTADPAGLPPDSVSDLAPAVNALVLGAADKSEVPDGVVELVAVDVMDVVAGRDEPSVMLLPDVDVLHDLSSTDTDPVVSLCGEGHGFTVVHAHVTAPTLGRSEVGAFGSYRNVGKNRDAPPAPPYPCGGWT
jgi:hypothetical protein